MYTLIILGIIAALVLTYRFMPSGREFPAATKPLVKLADPVLLPAMMPTQRVRTFFAPVARVDVNELHRHEHVLVPSKPGRPSRLAKEAVFVGISRRNPARVVLLSGSGQSYERDRKDVLRRA